MTRRVILDRLGAEEAPQLLPGSTFTVQFPEMPPTFCDLAEKKDVKAQMTVFLPRNYDPQRKHPLFIFLNGSDGGNASNPTTDAANFQITSFAGVDYATRASVQSQLAAGNPANHV